MALFRQLWFLVLVAMAAGIAVGRLDPSVGTQMKPLGDGFVALMRMMIAPVIFCTVVHGVAGMNNAGRVGRVAGKALLYFLAITSIALVFALVAVNLVQPGAGMNIHLTPANANAVASYTAEAANQGVSAFLLGIIPTTFASALVQPNVLQVLLVSLLFAFALGASGERGAPAFRLIESLNAVFSRIVGYVMWASPIGAFGALAFTVATFGLAPLIKLAGLILEFYGVSAVFVAVVFGTVAGLSGVSLWRLLAYLRDEIVIVFATTSTETVLPRLMEKLKAAGCDESIVGLVVPTGYSFNLDGTCLYLATVAVFLAQATNTPLDVGKQVALVAVLLLTSKGAAGVPGAAFVVLAATLGTVGAIPVASVALVLGIHRLMAEALTFVNLIGNALAAIVVCRWEGAPNADRLAETFGLRRPQPAITRAAA